MPRQGGYFFSKAPGAKVSQYRTFSILGEVSTNDLRPVRKLKFDKTKYGKELLIDTVSHEQFDPGASAVLPDFYTIAFLQKAEGNFQINHHRIPVSNHTLLFIPPGQVTNIEGFDLQEGLLVFFDGAFLDLFFNEKFFTYKFHFFHNINAPYHLFLNAVDFQQVFAIVQGIHLDIRHPQMDQEHFLRSSLYHLLIRINRMYAGAYDIAEQVIADKRVLRLKHLLSRHSLQFSTTVLLAQELGISRTHLHKLCQSFFGKSPGLLIRERLILEAKKEILFSEKDIQQIAYGLNFSDASNFNRTFRKATGLTPLQYRAQFTK